MQVIGRLSLMVYSALVPHARASIVIKFTYRIDDMESFVKALELSLISKNWYSVLFLCLTLPDICGKVDYPDAGSKQRTINWFKKYIEPSYTITSCGSDRVFLSGADFYALRCALLHEGQDDISTQRAREVLEKFKFVQPLHQGIHIHNNMLNNTLQLQVDQLGKDVLNGVKEGLKDIKIEVPKMSKTKSMLSIQMLDLTKGFSI